jgi:malonyl-CoA/methylmalonyl-CoA synthetase
MAGGCIEFDQGNFDPAGVWERIRRGDVKVFSAVPTIYVRLSNYWDSVLSKRGDRDIYRSALSKINHFACSTSALPRKIFDQWLDLAGKPISERYGGSEFGNVYVNPPGRTVVPVCHFVVPCSHHGMFDIFVR